MYLGWESNPHSRKNWILNPARLPIPPPRHRVAKIVNYLFLYPQEYVPMAEELIYKFAKQNTIMSIVNLPPKIFACTNSMVLGKNIAAAYGIDLGNVITSTYSDGEFQPSYEESIRGTRIFIIASTNPGPENLMELLLMLDAAKRASARHITAVMPYFGWARQDRKDQPRVAIGAKLVANLLQSAGATRIITMDLHADQIQGFFEKPVDHLYASTIFMPYVKSLNLDNLTIASPDMGGSKRAYAYSKHLLCDVVICYKQRKKAQPIAPAPKTATFKSLFIIIPF